MKLKLQKNKPLKSLTTFKIGGSAKYYLLARTLPELKAAVKLKLPILVLGAGSNLLIPDKGFAGLVIQLGGKFEEIQINKKQAIAGAGVKIGRLLQRLAKAGLSGLEFMTGISGTVGGSVMMNAGVGERNMGSRIAWVKVMDERGRIKKYSQKQLKFGYRYSILQKKKAIILEAGLVLQRRQGTAIRQAMQELMRKRLERYPYNLPSAGSFFKNPKGAYAGKLIEAAGCKGMRVGGAQVSEKHGNFIVNRKNASAREVLALAKKVQARVFKKFKVKLLPEVVVAAGS